MNSVKKLEELKKYRPRNGKYIKQKENLLNNVKALYEGRMLIYNLFSDEIFPYFKNKVKDKSVSEGEFDSQSDQDADIIPPLETEEKAVRKINSRFSQQSIDPVKYYKKDEGLKILTPQQILTILPITLAQLQAGNNSQKLKNELRQLLYLLYGSKKLSKTGYESLIKTL